MNSKTFSTSHTQYHLNISHNSKHSLADPWFIIHKNHKIARSNTKNRRQEKYLHRSGELAIEKEEISLWMKIWLIKIDFLWRESIIQGKYSTFEASLKMGLCLFCEIVAQSLSLTLPDNVDYCLLSLCLRCRPLCLKNEKWNSATDEMQLKWTSNSLFQDLSRWIWYDLDLSSVVCGTHYSITLMVIAG